ncbi:hypothetical protein R6Q59_011164 [Mikania micrantha]
MFNRKLEPSGRDLHRKSEKGIGRAKFNRKSEVQSEVESSSSVAWYTISINQGREFLQSGRGGGAQREQSHGGSGDDRGHGGDDTVTAQIVWSHTSQPCKWW